MFSKSYPQQFFHKSEGFKIAQKLLIIWATFVRNFVDKNFQKLSNLVTLIDSNPCQCDQMARIFFIIWLFTTVIFAKKFITYCQLQVQNFADCIFKLSDWLTNLNIQSECLKMSEAKSYPNISLGRYRPRLWLNELFQNTQLRIQFPFQQLYFFLQRLLHSFLPHSRTHNRQLSTPLSKIHSLILKFIFAQMNKQKNTQHVQRTDPAMELFSRRIASPFSKKLDR